MLMRRLTPYIMLARFDRPIGWWLLLLPAWQAILLAAAQSGAAWEDVLRLMTLFLIGAIAMRGAGCVVNDLWDRRIDAKVARTKNRPIASGAIGTGAAIVFLMVLAAIGAGVLFTLPAAAIITGLCAIPLIIMYPLAKRIMPAPQIILALTYAWGALLGWAAMGAATFPPPEAWLLYAATAFWIFGYDTVYAIQDMADDARINIGSAALWLGAGIKPVVAICYGAKIALLIILGARMELGAAWLIGLALAAFHLAWQIRRIDLLTPQEAGAIFTSNRDCGLLIVGGALMEFMLR